MDCRCPHCQTTLRWRCWSLEELPVPGHQRGDFYSHYRRCPACGGAIVAVDHPALRNDWLWMRWVMPGIGLTAFGLFIPALGWLLLPGVILAILGLLLCIAWVLRGWLTWPVYRVFDLPRRRAWRLPGLDPAPPPLPQTEAQRRSWPRGGLPPGDDGVFCDAPEP